jgi:hypothetical protein
LSLRIFIGMGLAHVLFSCEGECMRSFHATEEAGEDSNCESLGLSSAQVNVYSFIICLVF